MTSGRERYTIEDLLRVMERLRDPQKGCPWDLEQDFQSIVPSTLEECYELAEAIEREDFPHVSEELGDVLFQVIFYAQLGREQSLFDFQDVVHTLVDKLLRRHPHVFHEGAIETPPPGTVSVDQVMQSWEDIKQSERTARAQSSLLDDVPLALPALPRAQKLQKRAARVGFDWEQPAAVLEALQGELEELREAVAHGGADAIEDEMGDVLFSCVNLARHLKLDAEATLRRSSSKFESRFTAMEALASERKLDLAELEADALEGLWKEVKQGARGH